MGRISDFYESRRDHNAVTKSITPGANATALASFSYRALRLDGSTERGQIRANGQPAALAELTARGLFPLEIVVATSRSGFAISPMPVAELAAGLRIFATLLDSGLPIRRASTIFAALAPASWSPIVSAIPPALREGRSLSAALTESRVSLPPVIIGIIRAGEVGGTVPNALRAAAELAESTAATRAAIRSALAYPILLALAGTASIGVLVTLVLPRFAAILGDLGQQLPPTTRLVLSLSSVAEQYGVRAVLLSFATIAFVHVWARTESGRAVIDAALLRMPIVGPLRHASATSRACAAIGALLESGVPIAHALTHGSIASGNGAIATRLLGARQSVITGRTLGSSLADSKAFTDSAVRLTRAGEETGRLPAMLIQASRIEGDRATEGVRHLVSLLEPALILSFAGVVALVAAGLLQAVYSVHPS